MNQLSIQRINVVEHRHSVFTSCHNNLGIVHITKEGQVNAVSWYGLCQPHDSFGQTFNLNFLIKKIVTMIISLVRL